MKIIDSLWKCIDGLQNIQPLANVRKQNNEADNNRCNHRDKHSASRYIFYPADHFVFIRRNEISNQLNCCI